MTKFRIKYRDKDPACPVFSVVIHAYDEEAAREKFFFDDDFDSDWELVSIKEVPDV